MERFQRFEAILSTSDFKYCSATQWNTGKIPKAWLTDMVFDRHTKVIYYEIWNRNKLVSRHPYLSENGKYCRFVDGEFVEII